ncbi:MAG: pyrroloquinoline quinone biosynthesis peptide chaperone PqqD [Rhodomicrobiaceae bacterium]
MAESEARRARKRLIIRDDSRPVLPRFVHLHEDRVRGRWVLLAPERIVEPDEVAIEVLRLCDGLRTVGQIAEELAASYDAPSAEILRDIVGLLQDLADKGYIRDNA